MDKDKVVYFIVFVVMLGVVVGLVSNLILPQGNLEESVTLTNNTNTQLVKTDLEENSEYIVNSTHVLVKGSDYNISYALGRVNCTNCSAAGNTGFNISYGYYEPNYLDSQRDRNIAILIGLAFALSILVALFLLLPRKGR